MHTFDVIVIGAGHAGCEAAIAAAKLGAKTLLLTTDPSTAARMPCNPSIGGIGKGQLVREIDALGGVMAQVADSTSLQIKLLNSSKGPAVQALRAQADKRRYASAMRNMLAGQANLEVRSGMAENLLTKNGAVSGVVASGSTYAARSVVLAAGTFLTGAVTIGDVSIPAGRMGERPALGMSESLREVGIELGRFQTATPPRIDARSIDFSLLAVEPGSDQPLSFSCERSGRQSPNLPCYLTYTDKATHQAVKRHLHRSPIKTGSVSEHGPRNCPSIDRKIINFPDKDHHPVFVEPEGLETIEMYLQGLTTAMPVDAQEDIVHSVPGLSGVRLTRPGYAVSYDYVLPEQLDAALESRPVRGLFTAGQVNGTTGYEEAAAQGLVAGINAALKAQGKPLVTIGRDEAYIGVMIDDLITKGVTEPYRMLTSRAEFRLLLRNDNAEARLTPQGREVGLISDERYSRFQARHEAAERLNRFVAEKKLDAMLVRNPAKKLSELAELPVQDTDIVTAVEVEIRYKGYVERERIRVERHARLEHRDIPADLDYHRLAGISFEARERLSRVRPRSLGQAARVSGVSPADISLLTVHLERLRRDGR